MLRAERRTAHDGALHRRGFTPSVFPRVCRRPERRPTVGDRFPRTAEGITAFVARCGASTARRTCEASTPTWHFADASRGARRRAADPVDSVKTRLDRPAMRRRPIDCDARRTRGCVTAGQRGRHFQPPVAIRELRELCRGRHTLVQMRTRILQRLRAVNLLQPQRDRIGGSAAVVRLEIDRARYARRYRRGRRRSVATLRRTLAAVRREIEACRSRGADGRTPPIRSMMPGCNGFTAHRRCSATRCSSAPRSGTCDGFATQLAPSREWLRGLGARAMDAVAPCRYRETARITTTGFADGWPGSLVEAAMRQSATLGSDRPVGAAARDTQRRTSACSLRTCDAVCVRT